MPEVDALRPRQVKLREGLAVIKMRRCSDFKRTNRSVIAAPFDHGTSLTSITVSFRVERLLSKYSCIVVVYFSHQM